MAGVTGPPRVLHLIPTLDLGGAERQLRYLCLALPACGFEPHVAYLRGGPNLEPLVRAGVATHRLAASHRSPRLPLAFARLVRELRPAVVQTWLLAMDFIGGVVARTLAVPWLASERTLPSAYGELAWGRPSSVRAGTMWLRNRWVAHADAVVSNSVAADAWWAERLPARVRHRMIPNGLPLDELDALPPAEDALLFGVGRERPLVVFVGRIDEGKNIDNLLAALARVVREGPADALLLGDGVLLPKVRARVEREGLLGRIATPGYVAAAPAVLKRSALFLSLSRYEGMPNAVMEAAAVGCPIVLSDIPAHRAVLDDESAVFVPTEDPDAAARAVLASLHDPAAAKARAARARARATNWSGAAAARRYAELYRELSLRG
jgi:glycosyltransferase involved in cell wall biosynthesis